MLNKLTFCLFFESSSITEDPVNTYSYPDVRIDHLVPGYKASGRTSYALCHSGDYELEFGKSHMEWRGICLLTEITAILKNETHNIRAKSYLSSGTSYSQFEIVQIGTDEFEVRRVDSE